MVFCSSCIRLKCDPLPQLCAPAQATFFTLYRPALTARGPRGSDHRHGDYMSLDSAHPPHSDSLQGRHRAALSKHLPKFFLGQHTLLPSSPAQRTLGENGSHTQAQLPPAATQTPAQSSFQLLQKACG